MAKEKRVDQSTEATDVNLELDRIMTGGNSANRGDIKPRTEAEKANQAIQSEFYDDRDEDRNVDTTYPIIPQQPRD